MARGGVVIRGATASAYELTAPGTAGQVLTSNGAGADPTFQTIGEIVAAVMSAGHWSVMTNGDPSSPDVMFDSNGDVVMTFATGAVI